MAINFNNVTDIMLGQNQVTQIEDSLGNVLWSAAVEMKDYFYVEDISGSDNTLSIKKQSSSAPDIEVFCSTDQKNWTSMGTTDTDTTPITATVPANGKLYLKATANTWANTTNSNVITASGNHNVGGNIMSLLYDSNFENQTSFPADSTYTFYELFYNSTTLVNAQNLVLPAITLTVNCYNEMFSGCTSLTTAPALPATTLATQCYSIMFRGCTSLTTAPALPATTLALRCYGYMFRDCTSLTTAPALPATTLTTNCYYGMFRGCTSLTEAPALPATTLNERCYAAMFQNCTTLTTAPALPATTLAVRCYQSMFSGCTNLNSVVTYAQDISASYCLTDWLNNVSTTGNFYNMACTTYESGANGIPAGWTEHHTTASTINVTITNTSNYSGATYQIDNGTAQPINETDTTSFTVPATATNLTVNRNGKGTTDILGVCGISSDSEWTTVLPVNKMSDNVNIDLVNLM